MSNVIVIFRYIEMSKRINSIDIQILFYITFYEYDFAEIQSTNLHVSEKIKQIVINPRRKAETFSRNVT